MSKMIWAGVLVMAACGNGQMATGVDGHPITSDSAPAVTVTPGVCQMHKSTQVNTSGNATEYRTYFAAFDGVNPGDDFSIVTCGYTVTQIPPPTGGTCPPGYTCTEGGDALPAGPVTCVETNIYSFYGSTVLASCGTGTATYGANGALTGESDNHYTDVKLYRR